MSPGMVFALVIGKILLAGVPFNIVGILGNLITYPEIPHLHAPRSLPFDGVIGDAGCGRIVTMNGSTWMGMAQFFKGEAKNHAFFAVQE